MVSNLKPELYWDWFKATVVDQWRFKWSWSEWRIESLIMKLERILQPIFYSDRSRGNLQIRWIDRYSPVLLTLICYRIGAGKLLLGILKWAEWENNNICVPEITVEKKMCRSWCFKQCHVTKSRRISHNVCNYAISFEAYYSDLHCQ